MIDLSSSVCYKTLKQVRRSRKKEKTSTRVEGDLYKINMNGKGKMKKWLEDGQVNEMCEVLIKEEATTFKERREQEWLDEIVSRSKSLCDFCGYDLITEERLSKHRFEHRLGFPMCPICPSKPFFETKNAYLAHIQSHENLKDLRDCNFCCTKIYNSHRSWHIQAHKTLNLRRCYMNCHWQGKSNQGKSSFWNWLADA